MNNGFVIERHVNSELRYWGGHRADHFTPNHEEAIRFARAEDAGIVLAWLCDGMGRIAEHTWDDAVVPTLRPLEPLLSGETRREYLARVDAPGASA